MDAQSILTLVKILIVLVLVLAAYSLHLVFKLKGVDPFKKWDANKINGNLFLIFFVVGMILTIWATVSHYDLYGLITNPASVQGAKIDTLFWVTSIFAGTVFVVVNGVLLFFAYKYKGGEGKKAYYYPENHKLEIIWTVVPAVVLTGLILSGVSTWSEINKPAPANAIQFELLGKQFDWSIRYPGPDGKLGEGHVRFIDAVSGNSYGVNFDDANSHDDFLVDEIHVPVNTPVKVNIRAQDVLHSATMNAFRMKMDAVPGMTTSFWFTPNKTTAEMRVIRNNPKFNYELSCQEICGGGHWNMRRVIVVESMEEYKKWLAEKGQESYYAAWKKANAPKPEAAPADSVKSMPVDSLKKAPVEEKSHTSVSKSSKVNS